MKKIIFGNYGDNTIALIQWAHERQKKPVVVHVETGWAALTWVQRVQQGQALAQQYGFEIIGLVANPTFPEMVVDRGRFPSQKFQWCASFLKGLTFLQWADQVDSGCEAEIWLPSRRADSRARARLPKTIMTSDHFGGRKVVYPLCEYNNQSRDALIERAGFTPLYHRSLECEPCVHSNVADFQRMDDQSITRAAELEEVIEKPLYEPGRFGGRVGIKVVIEWAKGQPKQEETTLEALDMGCGASYGCGE